MPTATEPPVKETPGTASTEFLDTLAGNPKHDLPPKERVKEPVKEPETPEPEKPAPTKPKAKKTKEATPEPPQPAQPPIDYKEMGKAVAEGIAEVEKTKSAAAPKEPEVPASEQRRFDTLQHMEKMFPETKGIAKRFVESTQRAIAYQKAWEKDHPGGKFNASDDEHNSFFESNDIDWNDTQYEDAREDLIAARAAKKAKEEVSPELEEYRRDKKIKAAQSKIVASQIAAAKKYFDSLGEDYAGVLDDHGNLNRARIKELTETDPDRTVAMDAANGVELFSSELYQLANQLSSFDGKNQTHIFIAEFADKQEADIKSLSPKEQQMIYQRLCNDESGAVKSFATAEEFKAMTPAQQKQHWRLTDSSLSEMYAISESERVKKLMENEKKKFDSKVKTLGYVKPVTAAGATPGAATPAKETSPAPVKTPSPSGAIGQRVAPIPGQENGGKKSAVASFTETFLG